MKRSFGALMNGAFTVLWLNAILVVAGIGVSVPFAHAQGSTSDLMAKAVAEGQVRVIVGLTSPGAAFKAESTLTGAAAVAQRSSIATASRALINQLSRSNAQVYATWDSLPYVALKVDKTALQQLMTSPNVTTIQEDSLSSPSLASAMPFIGADATFAAGIDGSGQTVVILDTGIDGDHPFFGGRVVDEACFSNGGGGGVSLCPNGTNSQTGAGSADALTAQCLNGTSILCDHGTHVAGIAAGQDPGPPNSTGFSGVAPGANIIAIQVFTRFNTDAGCGGDPGSAPCVSAYVSDQMSGLDYVNNTLRPSWTISSVNMSLGDTVMNTSACDGDSRKAAIDNLLGNGIATVIAAGNSGFTNGLGAPGCISTAITVGAVTDPGDAVASFSNMHAVVDILAPGVGIDSSVPDDTYGNKSGTSMATPVITGAFAAIRMLDPAMTIAAILNLLQTTGVNVTDGRAANPTGASTGTTKPRIQLDAAAATLEEADLAIQKSDSPDPVNPGQQLTYEVTVTNNGPDGALHVVVTDTLPPQVSFDSDTDSCVEAPPGTLTCTLGSIPAGEARTFAIQVTVDPNLVDQVCEPLSITNHAAVTTTSIDTNADNNDVSTDTRVVFPLDHFQCYEVALQPFTARHGVQLDDQFGPGVVEVSRPKRLCAPANKNDEDSTAPLDACHLTGYEIDETLPFVPVPNQVVVNQFGTEVVEVGRPELLLVPTAKNLAGPPPALIDPTIDHFKCHRVHRARTRVSGVSVLDQFGALVADLKRPLRLCSPANKNNEGVLDPNVHLMCYEVRTLPPRPLFHGPIFISNQFDDLDLDITRTREFCVPSLVNPQGE